MNSLELAVRLVAGTPLTLASGFFVAFEFALTRARHYSEAGFLGDADGDFRGSRTFR